MSIIIIIIIIIIRYQPTIWILEFDTNFKGTCFANNWYVFAFTSY